MMSGCSRAAFSRSVWPSEGRQHVVVFDLELGLQQPHVGFDIVDNEDAGPTWRSAQEAAHGVEEIADRDGFGDVGLAAAIP